MSEQKVAKKVFGRGRGKPTKAEGPWTRSKKLDVTQDVRAPKKDEDEFVLTESGFPPLPGAENGTDGQFSDDTESAGSSSLVNGVSRVLDSGSEENQLADLMKNTLNIDNRTEHDNEDVKQNVLKDSLAEKTTEKNEIDNQRIQENEEYRNGNEEANPIASQSDNINLDVIANSNLSPFAEEFIPRGLNMNPEAAVFLPSLPSGDTTNSNRTTQSIVSDMNVCDKDAVLADLEETVQFCHSKLFESPGSFDELIGVVTPHFIKYMENPDLSVAIVQTLYNYAIQDSQFSYFAVKILNHLMQTTSDPTLRTILLQHTQEEVNRVNLMDASINNSNDIQPLLTFVSELYIQLEVGGRRLPPVGFALVDVLRRLLAAAKIPLKEKLRLIVTILKLTGLFLDQDNPTHLDNLFAELGIVLQQESSNLDDPTISFVNDILMLRNLRWGRAEPDYLESDEDQLNKREACAIAEMGLVFDAAPFDPTLAYSPGVFYGPDGCPMGQEEQHFLEVETNFVHNNQIEEQEPSPTSLDDGFDEAYDEFLRTLPGYSTSK